jgi:hypothetical protein
MARSSSRTGGLPSRAPASGGRGPVSGILAAADVVLPAPGIDRLGTDARVTGEIYRPATSDEQIEDAPTKLRRVFPSSRCRLL